MRTLIKIYRFFEGKKRRIGVIAFAIAPMLPGKSGQWAYIVGIVFGGTDLAMAGKQKLNGKKTG